MDLTALPITHRAEIPDDYLDEMGHMNVMWYTHLFSKAWGSSRWSDSTETSGRTRPVVSRSPYFRYLKEFALASVTIRSRVLGRSAKRWHSIHFMCIDELDALAATAEGFTHVDMRVRDLRHAASDHECH